MNEEARKEAAIKSVRLLKDKIGEDKIIYMLAMGYFEVVGKYGTYNIHQNGGVSLETEYKIGEKVRPLTWELCVGSEKGYKLPIGDELLTLFLMITEDEDNFVKTANFRNVSTRDEHRGAEVGECVLGTTTGYARGPRY